MEAAAKSPLINLFTVKTFLLSLNAISIIPITQQKKLVCSSLLVYALLQQEIHQHRTLLFFFFMFHDRIQNKNDYKDFTICAQFERTSDGLSIILGITWSWKSNTDLSCIQIKSNSEYKFRIHFQFWNLDCEVVSEMLVLNVFYDCIDSMKWSTYNLSNKGNLNV